MTDMESLFDRGAGRYDSMVRLNPGYRAHLRSATRELVARLDRRPPRRRLLDLACGSGVSTRELVVAAGAGTDILGVDLSKGMLERARSKPWPDSVCFQQGKSGHLDVAALGSGEWDGVFASYLFRNVPEDERDAAIGEVHELLSPGGWLVTQEYSVSEDRLAGLVWEAVSWGVIIPLGTLLDGNPGLYRYLRKSVHAFDSTTQFMARLAAAGFVEVACRTVPGWQRGILHTFVARKAVS